MPEFNGLVSGEIQDGLLNLRINKTSHLNFIKVHADPNLYPAHDSNDHLLLDLLVTILHIELFNKYS